MVAKSCSAFLDSLGLAGYKVTFTQKLHNDLHNELHNGTA